MCGIVGIFRYLGSSLTEEQYKHLEKMGHRVRFRGPDEYTHFYLDGTICMHFRRLSIIDVKGGKQPFVSDDGQVSVMVNGEIYNYQALKKSELADYPFKSHSDSEVILALYLRQGMDFLHKLNGMFAVSIYDHRKKTLFLIRDRLGIKPLFYAQTDKKELLFASEIKALAAHPDCPRKFDWLSSLTGQNLLHDIFSTNVSTYIKGIFQVEPGAYVAFSESGQKSKNWWNAQHPTIEQEKEDCRKPEELIEEYFHLLNDSVTLRLMSEVDVGIALSGGVDSVIISAFAAEKKPIETFTVLSESTYLNGDAVSAESAARILKLNNHQLYFPVKQNLIKPTDVKRILYDLEMPINMEQVYKYLLYRKIKTEYPNLKTLLMGQGSDEFNGGYGQELIQMYLPNIEKNKMNWGVFMEVLDYIQNKNLIQNFQPKLSHCSDILHKDLLSNLFKKPLYHPWHYYQQMYRRSVMNYNLWHEDRATAANSLENRVPFLDHRIVEFCFSVPERMQKQLFWDKKILRKGMEKILPKNLTQRKKVPFFFGDGARFTRQLAYEIMSEDDHAFIREAIFENPQVQGVLNLKVFQKKYASLKSGSNYAQAMNLFRFCNMGLLARWFHDGFPEPSEPISSELSWYTLKEYEQQLTQFIKK